MFFMPTKVIGSKHSLHGQLSLLTSLSSESHVANKISNLVRMYNCDLPQAAEPPDCTHNHHSDPLGHLLCIFKACAKLGT